MEVRRGQGGEQRRRQHAGSCARRPRTPPWSSADREQRLCWLGDLSSSTTHQASLHSVGHLHHLRLREAILLGDFLADVFEKRNHGVEGGSVRDELRVSLALPPRVSLALPPLLSHGLHSVSLLLHRLQAALLDRGVLNWGCRLWDSQVLILTLQLSSYSILDPGISTSSQTFSVTGLQALVVMVSSSVVQLGAWYSRG